MFDCIIINCSLSCYLRWLDQCGCAIKSNKYSHFFFSWKQMQESRALWISLDITSILAHRNEDFGRNNVLWNENIVVFFCCCWGFTAQSTQWGHVEHCQFTNYTFTGQLWAYSFARNWQLPFLNQRKGQNDRRKYFMINLHERMLPTGRGLNPQPPGLRLDGASN